MSRRRFLAVVLCVSCFLPASLLAPAAAGEEEAGGYLEQIGVTRGICVLLDDTECRTAIDLARSSELIIWVELSKAEDLAPACRAADEAGFYGTRIYVNRLAPGRISLADNLADAVIALGDPEVVPRAEVVRVLRPEGKALLGGTAVWRLWSDGTDDWSHHYHGPDNNPQSEDRLARAPFLTQFIAEPRYGPAPQAAVASAGRIFIAFGHVAWHEREESMMNTLIAVNGFNGTMLWKRPLKAGIMVDRCTMIATPKVLFLGGDTSCEMFNAATGQETGEIVVPDGITNGPFWKWMALEDGRLYALVGRSEPSDPDARWRRGEHGWPWNGISKGYNQSRYTWGFASTLVAMDPETKKVLWHHREDAPIDSRGTCLKNGRIYISRFGEYLACLDARTGEEIWRRTADKDKSVFDAIGAYRPGHGYIGGWKSTVYLKSSDKALYVVGPQVNWLTAISAEDGRVLWHFPGKDLHIVLRDDGLYTIGPQHSNDLTHRLDPLTGTVLASYPVNRRACTRSTGTADGILFRAPGGSTRLDLAAGHPQWISPMRPSCHVGVVIASGHLYWVPWACDCNLQMFGVISLGPAGNFEFGRYALPKDRLEVAEEAGKVAAFEVSAGDWPTYRANSIRTAQTQAAVPENAALRWRFTPKNAFEATAPVAAGGLVFAGGSDGIVRALDATDGKLRWKAYTAGTLRYPPSISEGRALVGSGDGWLYAFEAATGRLLWRFRAAPEPRTISVYGQLLSTWPVSSGIVAQDGVVYLAAGINNFDGTHVYALDIATGQIRWQNNDSGHLDRFSRRGVAAQGDMLLKGGELFLAGGNVISPGVYDAATGKCLNSPPIAQGSEAPRGRELVATDGGVKVCGQPLYSNQSNPVFDASVRWDPPVVVTKNARLACENRGSDKTPAWVLVAKGSKDGRELWAQPLEGEPVRWGIAVDGQGHVAVTLRDGRILCFGATD